MYSYTNYDKYLCCVHYMRRTTLFFSKVYILQTNFYCGPFFRYTFVFQIMCKIFSFFGFFFKKKINQMKLIKLTKFKSIKIKLERQFQTIIVYLKRKCSVH